VRERTFFASTQHPHALQLAGHPDLSAAVLDYRLGQEDTSAICVRLGQRGVPFMFHSGYDDMREQWPHAVRVPKPASPPELIQAVKEVLRSSFDQTRSRAA